MFVEMCSEPVLLFDSFVDIVLRTFMFEDLVLQRFFCLKSFILFSNQ